MPSYLPPVGWVSKWLPAAVGGPSLVPGRIANWFPMESVVRVQPRLWVVEANQSRACLSVSERESLDMPVSVGALFGYFALALALDC